ncbi:MAG: ABC transporter ATP-binding protein [Thermaceae bacterium]|nr:ABC transporter ATP-binding protein [Thermaceae bacterium]
MSEPILKLNNLCTVFHTARGRFTAVDGVNLELFPGEVLGLVGESGSGKSVTLRSILRLVRPPGRVSGEVRWRGRNLLSLSEPQMRQVRGGEISMIFQEPMTALNPVLPVGEQIAETLREHTELSGNALRQRAIELLELVGIPSPKERLRDYPHQFSGGMRQRVMIAIALASNPKLLLADEPTTALDVTIQDQILKLLLRLKDTLGMSVILVTHDLGVVAQTCERVAVMYAGRIVEVAPAAELFAQPRHAYTLGLLNSVPGAGSTRRPLIPIPGAPPDLTALPPGCSFAPRCAFATDECTAQRPPLMDISGPESPAVRLTACIHHDALSPAGEVTR